MADYWPQRYNTWPRIEDYWPRRLLHIPTMTSHVRDGKATYNHCERPKYSILSYTWGRWQVRDKTTSNATPLPVRNTTWEIPTVENNHFTVEQFQAVINQMGVDDIEWAWVDIACIDQENDAVKMDEVGRQASIFHNASKPFVWLSRISDADLRKAYYAIEDAAFASADVLLTDASTEEVLVLLRRLHWSVMCILSDPWFSSLWTLQELMMRSDALILTQQSAPVRVQSGHQPRLFMEFLMNLLSVLMDSVRVTSKGLSGTRFESIPEVEHLLVDMEDRIYRSGLPMALMGTNPNVQYGIAKFRTTTYPVDRVYGIMQMYNVRVGQAIRPTDHPSLEELVEEFGLAINSRSALLGQLFLHTAETKPGLSWCITEQSVLPLMLQSGFDLRRTRCTITKDDSGSVVAAGHLCEFQEFFDVNVASKSVVNMDLFFDHRVSQQLNTDNELFRRLDAWRDPDLWIRHGTDLIHHFGLGNLCLLLLGEGRYQYAHFQHYGLVLEKISAGPEPGSTFSYSRVGICRWSMARTRANFIEDTPSGTEPPPEFENQFQINPEAPRDWDKRTAYTQSITQIFSDAMHWKLV